MEAQDPSVQTQQLIAAHETAYWFMARDSFHMFSQFIISKAIPTTIDMGNLDGCMAFMLIIVCNNIGTVH